MIRWQEQWRSQEKGSWLKRWKRKPKHMKSLLSQDVKRHGLEAARRVAWEWLLFSNEF